MLPGTFFKMTRWQRTGALLLLALPLALAQGPDPNAPQPDESADNRPGRGVARVSVVAGDVSIRRGDSGDWLAAAPNAPLVVQDTVHAGVNSRAEVQMDRSNIIRLAPDSEIRFAELEYQRYGIQVASGTVSYRVLRELEADVEVSTPLASIRPTRRGAAFRVTVRPDGTTEITVRSGDVEIATGKGTERLSAGRTMLVRGTSADPEFQLISAIHRDEWDQWNENRDRELERSNAYKYVSSSVYGAEDLDQNGRWEYDPPYGNVWVPTVAADWAPYRNGQWSWVDYYGWSWVSYDPWGWAPYHYGRWYHGPRGWCWWPGSIGARHYWSPGLVAWVGFGHGGGFGRVGWVPLAPYEPYHPWYGWNHYRSGGRYGGSHIVNDVNITNVYRNARVNNGMTAVNSHDFTAGRAVRNVRLSAGEMQQANLMRGQLPITPERASQRLAERQLSKTPNSTSRSSFYSRRETSASAVNRPIPFDQQQRNVQELSRRVMSGNATAGAVDSGRSSGMRRSEMAASPVGSSSRMSERLGNGSQQTERGGWRRFGDPSPSSGNAVRSGEATANPAPARTEREGWRRFGDPGGRSSVSSQLSTSPSRQRSFEPGNSPSSGFGSGSRRSPETTYTQPRSTYESPRQGTSGRTSRGSGGESIGVSPSIVRERPQRQPSYSAPSPSYRGMDSGSSGRSGGFSAPTRSAPSFGGSSRGGSAPSGGSSGGSSSGGGARSGGGRGGRSR
ncbi:MAG: FecR domain-containing protein [Acidobacteria bacterium]|nr:FecR domain-containing protein [Acidobacteriota bacterium]